MKKIYFLFYALVLPFIMNSQTLNSIVPNSGNGGQTVDVTITGRHTHFTQGHNTVSVRYSMDTLVTVTVLNDSTLKARIIIPPTTYTGIYDVYVTNSMEGLLIYEKAFHIDGVPAPTLVSITPNVIDAGKSVHIFVKGNHTHFLSAPNSTILSIAASPLSTTNVSGMTIQNDTLIDAFVSFPPRMDTTDLSVWVQSPNEGTLVLTNGLHINGPPKPFLVSMDPTTVNAGQTLDITINGKYTHFRQANTTVSFNSTSGSSAITVNVTHLTSDTVVRCNITIPSDAGGDYKVSAFNTIDGSHSLYGFHVNKNSLTISPSTANAGDTLNIVVTGIETHFKSANTVVEFSQKSLIAVLKTTVITDTSIIAQVFIPHTTYTGNYDISVTNSIDGSIRLDKIFHVNGVNIASIVYLNPEGAKPGQTLDVTIVGTRSHFKTNGTAVDFNLKQASGVTVINSINVEDDSIMHVNITVPVNTVPGTYGLSVTNTTDGSINGMFKVYGDCLAHFTTTFDATNNMFTLKMDSATTSARFFSWNFGDSTFSSNQLPSHIFKLNKLYNVCLEIISQGNDTCQFCHIMGKDSSGNPVFRNKGFSLQVLPYTSIVTDIHTLPTNDKNVVVYPNPANGCITISTRNMDNPTVLSIYNVDGRLILQQTLIKDKTEINIDEFEKGIYIMHIIDNTNSKIIKFIKD